MIRFKTREQQKRYSFLVSSINIDYSYLNTSLSNLFSSKENDEKNNKKEVEEARDLLKDIAKVSTELENYINTVAGDENAK